MKLSSFFSKTFPKTSKAFAKNPFLVLDIGSDTVKALVCREGGGKLIVLGFGKSYLPYGDFRKEVMGNPEELRSRCEEAIRKAGRMASAGKPTRLVFSLGGNFVRGVSTTIRVVRTDPKTKIDIRELKNVFQQIHTRALERIRAQLREEGGLFVPYEDIKILDAKLQDTKIDGYTVETSLGLNGRVMTFTVFHTYLPSSYFEVINVLAVLLKRTFSGLVIPSYALFKTIEEEKNLEDFILIDIGGTVTEISIARKGILAGTKEFAVGGRTFSQRIARDLGIGFWEANHIKLQFARSLTSSFVSRRIEKIFEKDIALLVSGIHLSLKELSLLTILPHHIFMYGGSVHLKPLMKSLLLRKWTQDLPFSDPPEILRLSPRLEGVEDETRKLKMATWVVPVAVAKEFVRVPAEDEVAKALNSILRVMQP